MSSRQSTCKKEFLQVFRTLSRHRNDWKVWSDFCEMAAISISNAVDKTHYDAREARYLEIIGQYQKEEIDLFPQLLAVTVNALEVNPDQDFLGEMYMDLELGNHWKGQFFTPYNVATMMAEIQQGDDLQAKIDEKGFITVNDCCCGAGGLLIAFANAMARKTINYQFHILFVAQDIDPVVAQMCYIQLSLLGCAAEILIGNSITNTPVPSENRWYTPIYFHEIWHWRRVVFALSEVMFIGQTDEKRKGDAQYGESSKETEGVVGLQRRDEPHLWVFGGFAG